MVLSPRNREHNMLLLYNIFQLAILILLFPFLVIYILITPKYRTHIPGRLGRGLREHSADLDRSKKTIWLHALSVGEITSALQLIIQLNTLYGARYNIVCSSSTKSGLDLANRKLKQYCDSIIPFPLDIYPVVAFFLLKLKPNIFILVETDFWPNVLSCLARKNIPSILVNGRISERSFKNYMKFSHFFVHQFNSFTALCMQTDTDVEKLSALGISDKKIHKYGNLKYEPVSFERNPAVKFTLKSCTELILIAGSTHKGEERILLSVYNELRQKHTPFHLVIAPRNIYRAEEISSLAESMGVSIQKFSSGNVYRQDVLIVDTIGDLVTFYDYCDISFIGGSLVEQGGHNPLEPARLGKPVIFGPHMSDFQEIAQEMTDESAAFQVDSEVALSSVLQRLIDNPHLRKQYGLAGLNYANKMQGTLEKHLHLIDSIV